MNSLLFLYLNIICVNAIEFASFLNGKAFCSDTDSITLQNNNRTCLIRKCEEPLPLNAAVTSEQITQFTLENNDIKRLTQKQFHGLRSVKHLRFYENNVRQMDENALEGLKSLTNLIIIEPRLAIEDLRLSRESELKQLNLYLMMFNSKMLSTLPKDIMNLTIENTREVNGEISIPDHLVSLKYLRLKNCSVVSIKGPNVALSALEYLDLSQNKIISIDEKDFKDLKSLKVLQLNNNKIANLDPNAFRNNLNLTMVDLSYNNLKRIQLNYKEFHKYRVQAACNPISSESLQILPSYFNTDLIDCFEDHQKVPTESNNWVLVIIIIIIIIILSICIIFYIYKQCSKRKSLPKASNEVKECEATNENQSLIEVKPHLLFCGSEDGDSGQAISNLIQDAKPASTPTGPITSNEATNTRVSDDGDSGQAISNLIQDAKPASTSTGPITSNEATNTRVSDDGDSGQANSKLKHHVKPSLVAHRLIIPKNEKKKIDSEASSNLKRDAQPASTPTRLINSEDGDSGQANSILKLDIRTAPTSTRQSYPRKAKIDSETEESGSEESGSEDSDTGHPKPTLIRPSTLDPKLAEITNLVESINIGKK